MRSLQPDYAEPALELSTFGRHYYSYIIKFEPTSKWRIHAERWDADSSCALYEVATKKKKSFFFFFPIICHISCEESDKS